MVSLSVWLQQKMFDFNKKCLALIKASIRCLCFKKVNIKCLPLQAHNCKCLLWLRIQKNVHLVTSRPLRFPWPARYHNTKIFLKMQWHNILRKAISLLCMLSCKIAWKPLHKRCFSDEPSSESLILFCLHILSLFCLHSVSKLSPMTGRRQKATIQRQKYKGQKMETESSRLAIPSFYIYSILISPHYLL